jgi:hypothetical protein
MRKLFNAQGILYCRSGREIDFRDRRSTFLRAWRDNNIELSPKFTNIHDMTAYVNENFDMMVVGSDEVWRSNTAFFGEGVRIPKYAVAVSSGGSDIHKSRVSCLNEFVEIWTRDRHTKQYIERLGVAVNGVMPDPTFAFHFDKYDGLPTDADITPSQWFSSFANLTLPTVHSMHEALACVRGGVSCIVNDNRTKTRELVHDFRLDEPFNVEYVRGLCDEYCERWRAFLNSNQYLVDKRTSQHPVGSL